MGHIIIKCSHRLFQGKNKYKMYLAKLKQEWYDVTPPTKSEIYSAWL